MNILFLNSLADPTAGGGAEVIVWEQMRGLRDLGHACTLLATSDRRGLRRETIEGIDVWFAGLKNLYWPYSAGQPISAARAIWHLVDSYNPIMQRLIRQVSNKVQPDVVSIHNVAGWSVAAWQSFKRMGVPVVQVLHDYYHICPSATMFRGGHNCVRQCATCMGFRGPHRALSKSLTAVVGVSQFILKRHQSLGYFGGVSRQLVIHNARDSNALGISEMCPVARRKVRFGYIGRLDETKGLDPMLAAFRDAHLPGVELWIAGTGKDAYERRLRCLAAECNVRFLGRVTPKEFYPNVDVVIVPSLWNDNLPGVVFEALAFGRPVIGSKRGGIPEMIQDGSNGLLIEPKEPRSISSAIQLLANDAGLRERMSVSAKASAQPFTDVGAWIARYVKLYQSCVATEYAE